MIESLPSVAQRIASMKLKDAESFEPETIEEKAVFALFLRSIQGDVKAFTLILDLLDATDDLDDSDIDGLSQSLRELAAKL